MKITPWLVETAFGLNDWFVLSCIALVYLIMYLLPRRFPSYVTLLLFAVLRNDGGCVRQLFGGTYF